MDIEPNTSHQNQDLSFDLSPSSPRERTEELGKRKHKKEHQVWNKRSL